MKTNWVNQTIWTGDNLEIMRGMNSGCVDLIYLDPPFNSKANYAAPIGSVAAGAAFKDTWSLSDVDVAWLILIESKYAALHRVIMAAMTASDKSYLAYMAVRYSQIWCTAVGHAAALLFLLITSSPFLNFTPSMTLPSCRKPRSRFQDFSALIPIL